MNLVLELLGRAVPIILGAGTVQLGIFLLKRRSELRALDAATARTGAETGAVVVTSAERSVALSDVVRDSAVRRANEAVARAEALEVELAVQVHQVKAVTARLAAVEGEVARLNITVADLRASAGH